METEADYACHHCERTFNIRNDLMKHVKIEHIETVTKCKNFAEGNCSLRRESCWFLHDEKTDERAPGKSTEERNDNLNDSVFCEAKRKTPPDQMNQLIEIITKLSVKVENMEKRMK